MSASRFRNHPRLVLTVALLAAVAGAAAWQRDAVIGQEPTKPINKDALRHAESLSDAFNSAAEVAMPSVVTIRSRTKAQPVSRNRGGGGNGENPLKGTPFEGLFDGRDPDGMAPNHPRQGMGSGVIIDRSGIVLTNNHVVEGADEVIVHLADGREFKAEDIKTDEQTDLAVLTIKGAGSLPAATMGDSDKLRIGSWVMAIGNPFELEQTVSAGIISGMGRDLNTRSREIRARFLQTDAAINPGNSGGPLVNLHGEVIGINTAIATNTGTYSGIGFAIPINVAKWVTGQLIKKGQVERAYLGVGIKQVSPELAAKFGAKPGSGVLVTQVHPNTPAAEAGFEAGDVVVKFGDQEVNGPSQLQSFVERVPIDSKNAVEVLRDGKHVTLSVTARPLPKEFALAARNTPLQAEKPQPENAFEADDLGMEVADLTVDKAEELGLKPNAGVVITAVKPGTPAGEQGLRAGMVVLKVGKKDVKSVDEFKSAIKGESLKEGVLLYVHARNGNDFVLLKE